VKPIEISEATTRLLSDLPGALDNGQIVAFFQPEVVLASGKVVAAEALARWQHPDLGTLLPAVFLPAIEELGLMGKLTRLMLNASLQAHRSWAADGHDISVSVNVGPECVTDPDFPRVVADCLLRHEVAGRMLVLEVTEQTATAAMSSSVFAQLAELEVRVALDDFGTGLCSLARLGDWPVSELKLDMSLVRRIADTVSFQTIDLGHQLGALVVAEGVESEAVRSELEALGCDFGQGFFFARPMRADRFSRWLIEQDSVRPRRGERVRQLTPVRATPTAVDSATRPSSTLARRLKNAVRQAADQVGVSTLIAATVMLAAYALWQEFRWGGRQHQALIGDLAFVPVNGAAVVYALRVSWRQALGRATRRAWRLLCVALCFFMLGDLLQLLYETVLHVRAYPTWTDAAYLSFYVVALAGLLSFPSRRRTRSERLRILLDTGTVFVGGATIIWYVVLGPAVAGAGRFGLTDLVTFAYPVGDMLLLFGVLSILWRGTSRSSVASLRIFATGLLVFIAADITYDYITVHSTYLGGDRVDSLWILALTILFVAASCQLRANPLEELAKRQSGPATRPSALPYVAVAGSYGLLMEVGLRNVNFNPLGGLLLGAVMLTILVSLRQFAALWDNNRLAIRYHALASIDGLTGLYNRRHFMEMAEVVFAHAQRLNEPLAALMIDVDLFKQINDVHGHAVGDRVMRDLARSCRENVRPNDMAGRYGGDELVIVLPGADGANAALVAARLGRQPSRVIDQKGSPIKFTVSIGISDVAGCRDFQALLARADLALYEAKRAGRARWHTFEGTEPLDAGLPAAQPSPALLIGRPAGATRYRATRPDLSLEAPAGTL
jgi:diguanylate cyclase (GGDEF)-like protein